jgi:hypothetical protein
LSPRRRFPGSRLVSASFLSLPDIHEVLCRGADALASDDYLGTP